MKIAILGKGHKKWTYCVWLAPGAHKQARQQKIRSGPLVVLLKPKHFLANLMLLLQQDVLEGKESQQK